jgi:hypothetical protein
MAKKPLRIADALGFGASRRDLTQTYRRAVDRPATQYVGEVANPRRTYSQKIAQALTPNTKFGADIANRLSTFLDTFTPLGAEEPLVRARNAMGRGDYGDAVFQGALGILSGIPGAGGLEGKVAKNALEDIAKREIIASFAKPGVEPIVTQAGRSGLRLSDPELLRLAHASGGGSPFTAVKPRTPLEDFKFTKVATGNLPAGKIIDPQSLQNSMLVSLYGDKTDALKSITNFGGVDVNVPLNAGPRFGAMQQALGGKAAWASDGTPVKILRDRVREGLDQGRDVYGIVTAMGPAAGDQTVDMANLIIQSARGSNLDKSAIKKFDNAMEKIAPGFPGLMDEDAMRFLQAQPQGRRKQMIDMLDTAAFQDLGFPNIGAGRIAITDENILNAPAGSSGYSIVKFSPDTLLPMEPKIPHPSYGTQMSGEYVGQLPELVPFDLVFKDLIKQRRSQGLSAGSDLRSLELKKPNQVVDQETIDGIMSYISRLADQGK